MDGTSPPPASTAALQKSRMRHTWAFALPMGVLVLFIEPAGPEEVLEWTGMLLLIAAVLGRMVCSLYVGGRKNRALVADGPYSVVRNPLYLASFVGVLGIGLGTGMFTVAAMLVVLFALYYRHVVAREEGFLESAFGEDYRDYRRRVPRWLPDLRLWRSPAAIEVEPRYVLITLRDSAWFLVYVPAMELVEYLRDAGLVPALFRLY